MAIEKVVSVKKPGDNSGSGGGNADTVDGYHANATPTANNIPVLNADGNFPQGGLLGGIVEFTSNGTYTPSAGIKFIEGWLVAGGGAGGGASATAGTTVSVGAGGSGGQTRYFLLDASALGGTETVAIGAGGTGVSGAVGNSGSDSTFGSLVTSIGGTAGSFRTAAASDYISGASPSGGGSGGILIYGGAGGGGSCDNGNGRKALSGHGGTTPFGGGARSVNANTSGADGSGYGSGGGGAANGNSQSARTGGNGADGYLLIKEYF